MRKNVVGTEEANLISSLDLGYFLTKHEIVSLESKGSKAIKTISEIDSMEASGWLRVSIQPLILWLLSQRIR